MVSSGGCEQARSRSARSTFSSPGVGLVATPEGVRLLHESPRRLVHGCRWLSLALAAGVLAWGAVILLVPRSIGELVLRANWDAARSLLPPLLIALAGYGSSFGAWTGLRSLAAARRSLRARCIDGLLTFSSGWQVHTSAGATGVAWGYAVTGCLRSLNAWWQFSRALREHEPGPAPRRVPEAALAPRGERVPASGPRHPQ